MTKSKKEQSLVHLEQEKYRRSTRDEPAVTIAQSIVIGSLAGAIEVFVDHPLWSIKTRFQRGEAFTLNPSLLYRGILPNAASMVPITALQVSLNQGFHNLFFNDTTGLSDCKRITSAFVAGVGSSVVRCPTEMVMAHQSHTGNTFFVAGQQLVKNVGWRCLFTGLPATAMREGMFTTFFSQERLC